MSRYETPASIAEAAADYREATARIRTMRRNGGRTAATTHAVERWERVAERAMRFILDQRERATAGFLAEEAHLLDNLAQSVTPRPDLKRRLNTARRDLRCRIAYLASTR